MWATGVFKKKIIIIMVATSVLHAIFVFLELFKVVDKIKVKLNVSHGH